jgi:hypothetical protein
MHSAGEVNRGTGKVRNRCSDTGRQACIQQERQTEGQEKIHRCRRAAETQTERIAARHLSWQPCS